MSRIYHTAQGEKGFLLVVTMFMLVVLTLIAISATRTTNIEIQIAGNEKWSQEAFYQADGAAEATAMVIEQSIQNGGIDQNNYWNTYVNNLNFYMKERKELWNNSTITYNGDGTENTNDLDWTLAGVPAGSISRVDLYMPAATAATVKPYTLLKAAGDSEFNTGSALHMASGYEGFGQSAAHGGAQIVYDIWSNHYGKLNSEVMLRLQWRHVN